MWARGLIAASEAVHAFSANTPLPSAGGRLQVLECQPVYSSWGFSAPFPWPTSLQTRPAALNETWRNLHCAGAAAAASATTQPQLAASPKFPAPPSPSVPPLTPPAGLTADASVKQVLYRGTGMQLFRVLVRLKVFQLAGIAALAIPINTFLTTGGMSGTQALMASALVAGAGGASAALWYYSRRYVGELALLTSSQPGKPPRLRISVLDFWGHRKDNDMPLQALVPPLQNLPEAARRAMLQEPLLPVDVEGDRQYFLSVRYGRLVDPATLQALLAGQLEGQQLQVDDD